MKKLHMDANSKSGAASKTGSPRKMKRIGFMKGLGKIPDDFNTMAEDEIALMYTSPLFPPEDE
jgi:hypothetical protein